MNITSGLREVEFLRVVRSNLETGAEPHRLELEEEFGWSRTAE
jgi:hypothetical protein